MSVNLTLNLANSQFNSNVMRFNPNVIELKVDVDVCVWIRALVTSAFEIHSQNTMNIDSKNVSVPFTHFSISTTTLIMFMNTTNTRTFEWLKYLFK